MSLQFYVGRAGSGKTHRCMNEIVDLLRQDPTPSSSALIYLLPEQATAQSETALLGFPGIRGFSRAHVVSFKRLAYLVLNETGGAPRTFLDEQGRQMLLRVLIARHREELRVFANSARENGFIARLCATFTEMAQYRLSFDDLQARRVALESEGRGESLLAGKLHDLELLGRAWELRMGQQFSNSDHFLNELAERIEQSSLFDRADIWIDGFASFMPQEMRVLEIILKRARTMRISLLLDPDTITQIESAGLTDPTHLFNQSEETYLKIKALAYETGAEILPPLLLPQADTPTRFSSTPALESLEARLASTGMMATRLSDDVANAIEGLPQHLPPLVCAEADGRREEVEAVARVIRRLARTEGYRFRDMAVILRELDTYEPHIRQIFARHRIPIFLDKRRSISHHPMVELLRSSLRILTGGWATDDVVHYLKSDLVPITRDDADRLENLALERGWHGTRNWLSEKPNAKALGENDPDLTQLRLKVFQPLQLLRDNLKADGKSRETALDTADFTLAILKFLDHLKCGETLAAWAGEAKEAGRQEAADEHAQTWDGILALLREITHAMSGEEMALTELAEALETGLGSLTLGLVPPSLDQVLVGSIARSRQPELKAVFVLGMNDGIFPSPGSEDAILSDSEREFLREEGEMELAPTSTEKLFRERYLGYVALTRSSRHLWVSWANSTDEGKILRPSSFLEPFIQSAHDATPPLQHLRITKSILDVDSALFETTEQAMQSAVLFSNSPPLNATDQESGFWPTLRKHLLLLPEMRQQMHKITNPLSQNGSVLLGEDSTVPGAMKRLSVSRLETYANCPYKYFGTYMLSVEERREFEIGPMDIGSFHHEILSEVFHILLNKYGGDVPAPLPEGFPCQALDWGLVKRENCEAALNKAIEKLAPEFMSEGQIDDSQLHFFIERSRRQMRRILEAIRQQGYDDSFYQLAAECSFGGHDDVFPPLPLKTHGEQKVGLYGKIDRLDIGWMPGKGWLVRIIDFKSSAKNLALTNIMAGSALQLPLYLAATCFSDTREISPSGAFFFPLRQTIEKASAMPQEAPDDSVTVKSRGLFDSSHLALYDNDIEENKSSPHIAIRLKKDGEPGFPDADDWLPEGALTKLLACAQKTAETLTDGIQAGCFDVMPQRDGSSLPCAFCPLSDLCRIDIIPNPRYKIIHRQKKSEVLEEIERLSE